MKLSLNKLRIILLVLIGSVQGVIFAVSPIGISLLGIITILGFIWIVAETGTHASYTMAIGRMLEQLFSRATSKPKTQVTSDKGNQTEHKGTQERLYGIDSVKTSKQGKGVKSTGKPLTNGNVIG